MLLSGLEVALGSQESVLPLCPVCHAPVALEVAKTDENGRAIHEECYVLDTLTRRVEAQQNRQSSD